MNLLILGGTRFVGRHLVTAARERGHTVTLFNRGRSNPDLFRDVERLRGDRDPRAGAGGGLEALRGRRWDAAIDTSGFVPRVVAASARLLADACGRYVFVSSISVYGDPSRWPIAEDHPVGQLEDPAMEEVTGATYGPLKALCECEAERAFPGRALVVRPGLIVGPHDPTGRFTYWPRRVARGGEVLAPGRPEAPLQVIDARDLADWTVRSVEQGTAGTFNAAGPAWPAWPAGPAAPLTIGEVLETSRAVSGSDARFTWVDEAFLLERGVRYWQDLPALVPESDPSVAGMVRIDSARAIAAGLTFRPLADTIRDTLAWDAAQPQRPQDAPLQAGLAPEREAQLLAEWHARQ
jgi:2'-hydroxyisoflavone reductase